MKWYQRTGWILVFLIFFFPVGCYLMWKYRPGWNKWVKWPLTAVFGLWFLIIAIASLAPASSPDSLTLSEAPETPLISQADLDAKIQAAVDEALAESQALLAEKESELSEISGLLEETQDELEQTKAELEQTQDELETAEAANSRSSGSFSGSQASDSITDNASSQSADTGITNSQTVLITRTGSKYHTHKCGNGTYYEATLDEALARGLTPCEKCY